MRSEDLGLISTFTCSYNQDPPFVACISPQTAHHELFLRPFLLEAKGKLLQFAHKLAFNSLQVLFGWRF